MFKKADFEIGGNTKKEKLSYNATFALRRIASLSWSSLSENLMRDNIRYFAVQLFAKLSQGVGAKSSHLWTEKLQNNCLKKFSSFAVTR